ncbi:hypothetical protein ACJMK2_040905, partial [Sinanodonta woodiana]
YCSNFYISINKTQVDVAQKETHLQNNCNIWHHVQEGKITFTTLHSVCHTNPEAPSISLLKSLTSASISGQTHHMEDNTQKTKMRYAIWDMVTYVCCGKGCIEIKCPNSAEDNVMSCRTHPYYSQVQCHLHMPGSEYCEFIVWTKSDMFIESIEPNTAFWNSVLSKANMCLAVCSTVRTGCKIFHKCKKKDDLKPHISITRSYQVESVTNYQSSEEELWCSCRKPGYGRMIACDDK